MRESWNRDREKPETLSSIVPRGECNPRSFCNKINSDPADTRPSSKFPTRLPWAWKMYRTRRHRPYNTRAGVCIMRLFKVKIRDRRYKTENQENLCPLPLHNIVDIRHKMPVYTCYTCNYISRATTTWRMARVEIAYIFSLLQLKLLYDRYKEFHLFLRKKYLAENSLTCFTFLKISAAYHSIP